MEEPQQQQVAPHCVKRVKRRRKIVDHSNVILALPAVYPFPPKKMVPRAAGKKRVVTDQNTTAGPSRNNKNRKGAPAPKDALTKGRLGKKENCKAARAPNDAVTKGLLASVDISNGANNEHSVQEDQTGIIQQNNFSNTGDSIVEDRSSDAIEPKVVSNERYIPEKEAVQQPNDMNNEQQIMEEQEGVDDQQNVTVNQQYLPDEQAGIMQEQNIENAIEENVPEDPSVFADIFNFPLNNELVDLTKIEGVLEDPIGVENEQNMINNQQHIPDQQAGIVQQEVPENGIEEVVAEEDPAVFQDIFNFPLNNQLMDLD